MAFLLNGCKERWDFSTEPGFVVDDIAISNISLKCGETQHGDTATYHVKCMFSADVKHPVAFIPTGRLLKITKWLPLEKIAREDLEQLKSAGLSEKWKDPDKNYVPIVGRDYSATFESTITPLFRLDLWNEKGEYVTTHVEAQTTIDVSAQKCEIVRVAGKKFYFCYDFGSK